jgi:hypothetical protein
LLPPKEGIERISLQAWFWMDKAIRKALDSGMSEGPLPVSR